MIKTNLLWISHLVSSYIEEYVDFRHFCVLRGEITAFDPFNPAFKVMAPCPQLIGKCVYLLNLTHDVCIDNFLKAHTNSLHWQIMSQIQTKYSGVRVASPD